MSTKVDGMPVLWQHGLGATQAQVAEVFPESSGSVASPWNAGATQIRSWAQLRLVDPAIC
jgi:hypothetical protein